MIATDTLVTCNCDSQACFTFVKAGCPLSVVHAPLLVSYRKLGLLGPCDTTWTQNKKSVSNQSWIYRVESIDIFYQYFTSRVAKNPQILLRGNKPGNEPVTLRNIGYFEVENPSRYSI